MLYLHAKLPKLFLSSLHNLCYFVDAVHFQQYGSSLFGTPARAATGVRYEIKLRGDAILNGVIEHFQETSAQEITSLIEKEPGVAAKTTGADVLSSCMRTEELQASEVVIQLKERSPLNFGESSEQAPMSITLSFAEPHVAITGTVQRLQDAMVEVHRLERDLARQLQELALTMPS
jgi:hypothetical protein